VQWENHYPGHRDLACQQARSRYTGKLVVSYEHSVTFNIMFIPSNQGEISLVNLSKGFLANRDNFYPYKQALTGSISMYEIVIKFYLSNDSFKY
jgi:hypothetical protein